MIKVRDGLILKQGADVAGSMCREEKRKRRWRSSRLSDAARISELRYAKE